MLDLIIDDVSENESDCGGYSPLELSHLSRAMHNNAALVKR
jgi:hypothetical protein